MSFMICRLIRAASTLNVHERCVCVLHLPIFHVALSHCKSIFLLADPIKPLVVSLLLTQQA